MTTEFNIKLKDQAGNDVEMTPGAFFQQLLRTPRIVEAHISLEEGRQRQQYEGVKRFTSRKIDFGWLWALIDTCTDESQRDYLRQCAHAAIHQTIMANEAVMYNELAHSLGRDGLSTCLRDPENPYVNTHNLAEALKALSTRGGRAAGHREGTIIR